MPMNPQTWQFLLENSVYWILNTWDVFTGRTQDLQWIPEQHMAHLDNMTYMHI